MSKFPRSLPVLLAVVALGVGATVAGAGGAPSTLEVDKIVSEAPSDVTVSNTADFASRCEAGTGLAQAEINVVFTPAVVVDLTLSNEAGVVRTDTVTPDVNGDWSFTYPALPVGEYQVTAQCRNELLGAAPEAGAPFTYVPVDFSVTPPTGGPDVTAPPGPDVDDRNDEIGPITANPSFTG